MFHENKHDEHYILKQCIIVLVPTVGDNIIVSSRKQGSLRRGLKQKTESLGVFYRSTSRTA